MLVVDPEPAVLDAMDRALRLEGYDMELATNGEPSPGSASSAGGGGPACRRRWNAS
jgi:hypothetical protein